MSLDEKKKLAAAQDVEKSKSKLLQPQQSTNSNSYSKPMNSKLQNIQSSSFQNKTCDDWSSFLSSAQNEKVKVGQKCDKTSPFDDLVIFDKKLNFQRQNPKDHLQDLLG